MFNKFSGDADASDLMSILWELLVWIYQLATAE